MTKPTATNFAADLPAVLAMAPREQFIPLRKHDLVETLAASATLSEGDAGRFRQLCQALEAVLHRDYQVALEKLKDVYAPFDPDADTRAAVGLTESDLVARRETLFQQFNWLLERGNFVRLAQEEIDRAVSSRSQWGMNLAVDFEIFDRLEIFYRGDVLGSRVRRRLWNRFRPETVRLPIYQRLVVIFRLRDDHHASEHLDTRAVYIKLFKDIPKLDVEMLLPGTQVQMSLFDRAKILLPTLSGVSIAVWKAVQGALLVAAAGLYNSLALLGLIGGTLGYGVRSFYGYLNTKQKYQLNLTQSLYYQNLDNNAGAIFRLLDEAEEQENREAMLAYFFLWRHAGASGWSTEQLDQKIEAFLRAQTNHDVDFEVADALAKLERLRLIVPGSQGGWRAVPIEAALATLSRHWTSLAA